jgi:hypothetical protein
MTLETGLRPEAGLSRIIDPFADPQVDWRFFGPEGNRLEGGEKFRVEWSKKGRGVMGVQEFKE